MADKDLGDGDGPSLEMPSLGSLFKRKKKPVEQDDAPTVSREELDAVVRGKKPSRDAERDNAETDVAEPDAHPTAADPDDATPEASTTSESVESADTPAATRPDASADDETPTAVVPSVAEESDVEHTTVLPEVDGHSGDAADDPSPASDVPADAPLAEEAPAKAEPARAEPATSTPASADNSDRPLFTDEVEAADTPDADEDQGEAADLGADDDLEDLDADDDVDDDEAAEERTPRARRSFALPPLPGRVAAAVTGLVVGVLAVAMTYLAVQGCEKVKGTSSCGTPGFFLLIAIMILLVVLGSSLLNAWQLAEPGSTSFMAVALVAVVALLFLIQVIFSPWMIVVIPLVAVVAFVGSQWLTSLFTDEESTDADADAPA